MLNIYIAQGTLSLALARVLTQHNIQHRLWASPHNLTIQGFLDYAAERAPDSVSDSVPTIEPRHIFVNPSEVSPGSTADISIIRSGPIAKAWPTVLYSEPRIRLPEAHRPPRQRHVLPYEITPDLLGQSVAAQLGSGKDARLVALCVTNSVILSVMQRALGELQDGVMAALLPEIATERMEFPFEKTWMLRSSGWTLDHAEVERIRAYDGASSDDVRAIFAGLVAAQEYIPSPYDAEQDTTEHPTSIFLTRLPSQLHHLAADLWIRDQSTPHSRSGLILAAPDSVFFIGPLAQVQVLNARYPGHVWASPSSTSSLQDSLDIKHVRGLAWLVSAAWQSAGPVNVHELRCDLGAIQPKCD